MTGLNSGMDTQSIVEQLVKVKSSKKEKLEKSQTKLEWKQEAWKELNSKIYSFYTDQLDALRFESGYNSKKKATVGNAAAASVTAGGNSVNGTQTLAVKKLAQTQYITGKSYGDDVTGDTKLSSVFGTDVQFPKKIDVNGKKIDLNGDMTMKEFATALSGAGLNANFDNATHRLFVSSKESGLAGAFEIKEVDVDGSVKSSPELMKSLGLSEDSTTGMVSKTFGVNRTGSSKLSEVFGDKYFWSNNGVQGSYSSDTPVTQKLSINGTTIELQGDMTMDQMASKISEVEGISARFDSVSHRLVIESADGKPVDIKDANTGNEPSGLLKAMGLSKQEKASVIEAQDAEIELNGATFTSAKNVFEVNGLTITAKETTGYDLIDSSLGDTEENRKYKTTSITVDTDTEGIYDMVKDFFKKYNELINEMSKLYNEESSVKNKYEPLTDEEKEAMSDEEVEKWEQKIKDSLLSRDSNLNSVIQTMTAGLAESIKLDNGKSYSLASFGINTLSYFEAAENERYAYHIDGDQDDGTTKGNTDLLRSGINTNFEDFRSFMTKLTGNLYSTLNKQMARTEYRSIYHLYDDKAMQSEYDKYKEQISAEEEKISNFEDKWYDKFAQMEKAMTQVNAKQSAISSLLGM